jgi:NADH dehydrogenase/putative oxidoreductase
MAMAGSGHGMTIYEPLLLALLAASGAGHYSLDHLIGCWTRRAVRFDPDMPHVVIVGAGFGGMACAAALRHEPVRVTLIDRENYHLFQPLLYQVATAALSPADITTPVRAAFRDNARMRVLRGTVTAVDTDARQVIADGRARIRHARARDRCDARILRSRGMGSLRAGAEIVRGCHQYSQPHSQRL